MKSFILMLWKAVDPVYYACTRLRRAENSLFRVRLTRYKGRSIVLSDGCEIAKNDLLVKIHIHNVRIFKDLRHVKNDLKKTRLLYREVERSLPALADYIKSHRKRDEIRGVIGITMINRGYRRLGFEGSEISNRFYKWMKSMILVPIYLMSVKSPSFKQLKKQNPNYLFMSKHVLMARYTEQSEQKEKLPSIPI
ncbi:MAG TPA: hypothetical protein VF149_06680 [Bacillales bacterium]